MSELHDRLLEASGATGRAPIKRIRARVRRRRRARRALAVGAVAVVLVGGAVAASNLVGDDTVRVGTGGGDVEVPDVTGLRLAEAKQVLEDAGLEGRVVSGYVTRGGERIEWSDPDHPDAVVSAQEPPGGPNVFVPAGSVVGLRTGFADDELCSVFSQVPPRRGDAHDLAASPSFTDMLRDAREHADPQLAAAIDELLAHEAAEGTYVDAPSLALSKVTAHHDACAEIAGEDVDFEAAMAPLGPWKANHDKLIDQGEQVDVRAFELGAWFALADHCRNQGQPAEACYGRAAEFMDEVLRNDPRSIAYDTRLDRGGVLAGAVGAAYDITRNTLGVDVQEPVEQTTLYEDRPSAWG